MGRAGLVGVHPALEGLDRTELSSLSFFWGQGRRGGVHPCNCSCDWRCAPATPSRDIPSLEAGGWGLVRVVNGSSAAEWYDAPVIATGEVQCGPGGY